MVFYNSFTKTPTSLAFKHCKPPITGSGHRAWTVCASAIALCGCDSIQRHRLYLFCSTFCFIAIYSNYKLQFKIYTDPILSPIVHRLQTLPGILRGRDYANQRNKRRMTTHNSESAHSIAWRKYFQRNSFSRRYSSPAATYYRRHKCKLPARQRAVLKKSCYKLATHPASQVIR